MIKKVAVSSLDKEKLAGIKVSPSTQANDFFDYSKVVVKKPWGYEYLMYQNELVAVWILYIKQGFQTSTHCHPNKKTSLIVLSGEVICSLLNENLSRTPGDGLLIDQGVFHSTQALSENGAFVIETETPNNKRDLVRLEDKYGRVGKGYETVEDMSYNLQNYNYVSFIDSKIYYNVTKKFGSCSLNLSKFKTAVDFKENFEQKFWDAVTILNGKITDKDGKTVLEPGDTIDLKKIRSLNHFKSEGSVEIIGIKKKDSLIKLSDYVFSFLEKQKVRDLFFVPGSSVVHLLDSAARNTNLRHIQTQTEQSAAMAAEAYAKLTNQLAVTLIPSGSSGVNALTGVADAWIDSSPLLVLSGQTRSDETSGGDPPAGKAGAHSCFSANDSLRQLGIQELNIVNIVKPITKYAVMVEEANTIRYHLEKAIFLAKEGRPGPVWIDIPIDIQGMVIDEDELTSFVPQEIKVNSEKQLTEKILETIRLLQNAKRPVLLVGNGIRIANSEIELLKLIDLLSIPVLVSRRGADLIPDRHPLFFGRPGAYGLRSANFIIQNSDLLVSIGSRLSLPQIGRNHKAFARAATRIIIDIDQKELEKKTLSSHLAICCSAKEFIVRLNAQILEMKKSPVRKEMIGKWIQQCKKWKSNYSDIGEDHRDKSAPVDAYAFVRTLSQALNEGDFMTVDGGAPMIFFMQSFSFQSKQRCISATGLENTSFALPAAIGCSVAGNGKRIVCVCEDHGFQKNVQELKTIIKYNLPIKIFVLNTGGCPYLIRETQREYFGGRYIAQEAGEETVATNIVPIGESYKIPSFKIAQTRELAEKIEAVLKLKGPSICEVIIDKNQKISPKLVFTVKPDGKWISKPLEDMYPFLNREEFKNNMLIDILPEE